MTSKFATDTDNGAREALLDILDDDETAADQLLAKLWVEGFKIVPLAAMPTTTLRAAARAWRDCDLGLRSGWLSWLLPEPNMSLHDRIDDLINEIERLRT